jgi:hypothetical protein
MVKRFDDLDSTMLPDDGRCIPQVPAVVFIATKNSVKVIIIGIKPQSRLSYFLNNH